MKSFLSSRKPLTQAEINLMNKVLDRVAREGPLMVKDFENDRLVPSSGWWDWRPSKMALERLYQDGFKGRSKTKGVSCPQSSL